MAGELVVLPARCLSGVTHQCGLAALAARRIGVGALSIGLGIWRWRRLRNVANDPGEEVLLGTEYVTLRWPYVLCPLSEQKDWKRGYRGRQELA